MPDNDKQVGNPAQGQSGQGTVDYEKQYKEIQAAYTKSQQELAKLQKEVLPQLENQHQMTQQELATWKKFWKDNGAHWDNYVKFFADAQAGKQPGQKRQAQGQQQEDWLSSFDNPNQSDNSAAYREQYEALAKQNQALANQFQELNQVLAFKEKGIQDMFNFAINLGRVRDKNANNPDYNEDELLKEMDRLKTLDVDAVYQRLHGPRLEEKRIQTRVQEELKKREEAEKAAAVKNEVGNLQRVDNIVPLPEKMKMALERARESGAISPLITSPAEKIRQMQQATQDNYKEAIEKHGIENFRG